MKSEKVNKRAIQNVGARSSTNTRKLVPPHNYNDLEDLNNIKSIDSIAANGTHKAYERFIKITDERVEVRTVDRRKNKIDILYKQNSGVVPNIY